jgi:hypothetical protein
MLRPAALPLLLLLSACDTEEPDGKDTPTDTDGADTDPGTDTDPVDDTDPADDTDGAPDTDETEDTDLPAPLVDTGGSISWGHVVSALRVMATAQGFDLDGDGTVDNALGSTEAFLNPLLNQQYGSIPLYAGTGITGLGPNNGVGELGIFALEDMDTDIADNFSGTEELSLSLGGGAVVTALVDVAPDGTYSTVLPAGTITIGPIALPTSTPIHIEGTISADTHTGRLGAAVPQTAVDALAVQFGLPTFVINLVSGLADIDSDGDGQADSISAGLRFEGVSCVIVTP